MRKVGTLAICLAIAACASRPGYHPPGSTGGYALLVPEGSRSDPLPDQLASALRRRGVRVDRQVRGDRGPTAVLIAKAVRAGEGDAGPGQWLHAWLHDTRTGRLLATASVPADSLAAAPGPVAAALADSLLADLGRRRRE